LSFSLFSGIIGKNSNRTLNHAFGPLAAPRPDWGGPYRLYRPDLDLRIFYADAWGLILRQHLMADHLNVDARAEIPAGLLCFFPAPEQTMFGGG
jgi:hypothetical protein